jgi:hypothetical protein
MAQPKTRKDATTERLRQLVQQSVPVVRETERADAFLCILSFQSISFPERHVWVDTKLDGIGVDLEDWNVEGEWDNAVARVKVESLEDAAELIQTWLSGESLEKYSNVNKEYQKITKK